MKQYIRILSLYCIIFFIGKNVFSQKIAKDTFCSCSYNLDFLIKKITKNYIGYRYKVKGKEAQLQHFTDSLQKEAQIIGSKNCIPILQSWLSFFEDNHLHLAFIEAKAPFTLTHDFFDNAEKIDMSEEKTKQYLLKNKKRLDPIEGIWQLPSGKLMGIIKDKIPNTFVGFTITADMVFWQPGEVRMRIQKTNNKYSTSFTGFDHQKYNYSVFLENPSDTLLTLNFVGLSVSWQKAFPKETRQKNKTLYAPAQENFSVSSVDEKTLVLVLPNFLHESKKTLDSLIKIHKEQFLRTPNLIIDLRNNLGGTIFIYNEVLELLNTNAIVKPSFSRLATEDNIALARTLLKDTTQKASWAAWEAFAQDMEKHKDQIYGAAAPDTIKFDTVYNYPSKVALLINEGTGSAGEFFVLAARQSNKVRIFGQPTAGGATFMTNINTNSLPCPMYIYSYPISQNNDLLKDGDGRTRIYPDETITYQVKDWIKWVKLKFNDW